MSLPSRRLVLLAPLALAAWTVGVPPVKAVWDGPFVVNVAEPLDRPLDQLPPGGVRLGKWLFRPAVSWS